MPSGLAPNAAFGSATADGSGTLNRSQILGDADTTASGGAARSLDEQVVQKKRRIAIQEITTVSSRRTSSWDLSNGPTQSEGCSGGHPDINFTQKGHSEAGVRSFKGVCIEGSDL